MLLVASSIAHLPSVSSERQSALDRDGYREVASLLRGVSGCNIGAIQKPLPNHGFSLVSPPFFGSLSVATPTAKRFHDTSPYPWVRVKSLPSVKVDDEPSESTGTPAILANCETSSCRQSAILPFANWYLLVRFPDYFDSRVLPPLISHVISANDTNSSAFHRNGGAHPGFDGA